LSAKRVEVRVLDDERVAVIDAMPAERQVARRPLLLHADAGLEPLVVGVDQGDEGDLGAAQIGREARHVVERLLRRRVDDVARLEERESPLLVVGYLRLDHARERA
jgi:hypothetical protein